MELKDWGLSQLGMDIWAKKAIDKYKEENLIEDILNIK